jgi:hypothetical protein
MEPWSKSSRLRPRAPANAQHPLDREISLAATALGPPRRSHDATLQETAATGRRACAQRCENSKSCESKLRDLVGSRSRLHLHDTLVSRRVNSRPTRRTPRRARCAISRLARAGSPDCERSGDFAGATCLSLVRCEHLGTQTNVFCRANGASAVRRGSNPLRPRRLRIIARASRPPSCCTRNSMTVCRSGTSFKPTGVRHHDPFVRPSHRETRCRGAPQLMTPTAPARR